MRGADRRRQQPADQTLIDKVGLSDVPGIRFLVTGVTLVITLLAAWGLFTFAIARMPRVTFPWRNAARAGLLSAVAFVISASSRRSSSAPR